MISWNTTLPDYLTDKVLIVYFWNLTSMLWIKWASRNGCHTSIPRAKKLIHWLVDLLDLMFKQPGTQTQSIQGSPGMLFWTDIDKVLVLVFPSYSKQMSNYIFQPWGCLFFSYEFLQIYVFIDISDQTVLIFYPPLLLHGCSLDFFFSVFVCFLLFF